MFMKTLQLVMDLVKGSLSSEVSGFAHCFKHVGFTDEEIVRLSGRL